MCQILEAQVLEKNVGIPFRLSRLFESRDIAPNPEGWPAVRPVPAKRVAWAPGPKDLAQVADENRSG